MKTLDGRILHDTFVERGVQSERLKAALANVFSLSPTNIFFEGEDTSGWNHEPFYAFVYAVKDSDIAWTLDILARHDIDVDVAMTALSKELASIILYDEVSQQYRDDVIAFDGTGRRAAASLRSEDADDEKGDARFYYDMRPTFE